MLTRQSLSTAVLSHLGLPYSRSWGDYLRQTASCEELAAAQMEPRHAPERFGTVEAGVYRSSVLQPLNFQFVSDLNLKTIVHLSPEVTLRAVSKFINEKKIKLLHLGLKFWRPSGWSLISEELVKEALEVVLDRRNHPMLIMCTSGVHLTGTVVGCLRRLQQHSFTSIMDELRSFAHPTHTRYANETFIEFFDVDLVSLPQDLPRWFGRATSVSQRKFVLPTRKPRKLAQDGSEANDPDSPESMERLPAYQRHFWDCTGPLAEAWYKDAVKETKTSDLLEPLPLLTPSNLGGEGGQIRTEKTDKRVIQDDEISNSGVNGDGADEDDDDDDEEEDAAIEVEIENDVLVIRFARRAI